MSFTTKDTMDEVLDQALEARDAGRGVVAVGA